MKKYVAVETARQEIEVRVPSDLSFGKLTIDAQSVSDWLLRELPIGEQYNALVTAVVSGGPMEWPMLRERHWVSREAGLARPVASAGERVGRNVSRAEFEGLAKGVYSIKIDVGVYYAGNEPIDNPEGIEKHRRALQLQKSFQRRVRDIDSVKVEANTWVKLEVADE